MNVDLLYSFDSKFNYLNVGYVFFIFNKKNNEIHIIVIIIEELLFVFCNKIYLFSGLLLLGTDLICQTLRYFLIICIYKATGTSFQRPGKSKPVFLTAAYRKKKMLCFCTSDF